MPTDHIYDKEMESDDELQDLARRLMGTPAYDPERGRLHIRISRDRITPSHKQKAVYAILCSDIAKQIVLTDDGEYIHARDYDGTVDIRWLTPEQWRGIFAAMILGMETVPQPDEATGVIMLLRSTKNLSRSQLSEAIELAKMFGSTREVEWTPPKDERSNP